MKNIYFLLLFALVFVSCNKYEEGPAISFRSKTSRLANDWVIEKAFINDVEKTDSLPQFTITFEKSGDVTKTAYFQTATGLDSVTKTGLWEFDNDAENVLILFADNFGVNESRIWRIIKLTNDEFWFEEKDSMNLLEYHLMEKP